MMKIYDDEVVVVTRQLLFKWTRLEKMQATSVFAIVWQDRLVVCIEIVVSTSE